jgi:hypothetical protein
MVDPSCAPSLGLDAQPALVSRMSGERLVKHVQQEEDADPEHDLRGNALSPRDLFIEVVFGHA